MLEYIWNNWWQVMDWLADETVTDWLSIAAGYVAYAIVFATLLPPAGLFAMLFNRRVRVMVVVSILVLGAVAFIVSMFQVHDLLNLYQSWYQGPLGPAL